MASLTDISRADLEKAVGIFLDEAYEGNAPPERIRPRLDWPGGETAADVTAADVFERAPSGAPPEQCSRIRLRLGNPRYPHMKFGLDRVPGTGDWVLTVDCHDQMLVEAAQAGEQKAVEAITQCNAELKTRIERRWAEAGLPTFEQYVRDRLPGRKAADRRGDQ